MREICKDVFTLRLLFHIRCHFDIDKDDEIKEFVAKQGSSNPFTVDFIYILGTDYDVNHPQFGFFSEYPANAQGQSLSGLGIRIDTEVWTPLAPDTESGPADILMGTYSAVLHWPANESQFNAILNASRTKMIFDATLGYNQGVAA